jgi:hypothetical protein
MKKLILLLSLIVLSYTAQSQTSDWILHSSEKGISFYSKTAECHIVQEGLHQEMLLLKLVNTTSNDVTVSFNLELWSDKIQMNKESMDEFYYSIPLKAGESVEGKCEQLLNSPYRLEIFIKFLERDTRAPIMTHFSIVNLKVQ